MAGPEDIAYRRGRSGRPIQRIRDHLRKTGVHICWLCGGFIQVDLPDTHPMSWTLDHVLPLSTHPHLALEPTNHREAHRRCNSSRGNRTTTQGKTSRNW
ncbi:HNH endonuclease [Streptomyces sp. NPDC002666]